MRGDALFVGLVALVSAKKVGQGIEAANRVAAQACSIALRASRQGGANDNEVTVPEFANGVWRTEMRGVYWECGIDCMIGGKVARGCLVIWERCHEQR
jgi:hypothetical protein